MRIDHGLLTGADARTRILRGVLDCPHAEVYGLRLWAYATEQRRWTWERGELVPAVVAAACAYPGDPGTFFRALKTAGWLRETEDGWLEVAGYIDINRKSISNIANGGLGGRPRKPNGKPNGNPVDNPKEPPQKPNGEPNGKPNGNPVDNPTVTQRAANGLSAEAALLPAPDVPPQTPPLIPTPDPDPPLFECSPDGDEQQPTLTATRRAFRVPTVAEIGAYCQSRGNGVDPQAFWDHYQAKGWVIGKSPMKDWQSAVRTWERDRRSAGVRADAAKDYSV